MPSASPAFSYSTLLATLGGGRYVHFTDEATEALRDQAQGHLVRKVYSQN